MRRAASSWTAAAAASALTVEGFNGVPPDTPRAAA